MITLDAIKSLSRPDNPIASEGEEPDTDRYQITVEVHPDRHIGQHFYAIRRGYGKFSIARTPERTLYYVKQRRRIGKR